MSPQLLWTINVQRVDDIGISTFVDGLDQIRSLFEGALPSEMLTKVEVVIVSRAIFISEIQILICLSLVAILSIFVIAEIMPLFFYCCFWSFCILLLFVLSILYKSCLILDLSQSRPISASLHFRMLISLKIALRIVVSLIASHFEIAVVIRPLIRLKMLILLLNGLRLPTVVLVFMRRIAFYLTIVL